MTIPTIIEKELRTSPDADSYTIADRVVNSIDMGSFATLYEPLSVLLIQERIDNNVQPATWNFSREAEEHRILNLLGLTAGLTAIRGMPESIQDSTRRMLRSSIRLSIDEGTALDLSANYAFSRSRMENIARYETVSAANDGLLDGYRGSSRWGKRWLTAQDALVEEVCAMNEQQGVIPVDQPFLSGDMAPLAHPECRCSLQIEPL